MLNVVCSFLAVADDDDYLMQLKRKYGLLDDDPQSMSNVDLKKETLARLNGRTSSESALVGFVHAELSDGTESDTLSLHAAHERWDDTQIYDEPDDAYDHDSHRIDGQMYSHTIHEHERRSMSTSLYHDTDTTEELESGPMDTQVSRNKGTFNECEQVSHDNHTAHEHGTCRSLDTLREQKLSGKVSTNFTPSLKHLESPSQTKTLRVPASSPSTLLPFLPPIYDIDSVKKDSDIKLPSLSSIPKLDSPLSHVAVPTQQTRIPDSTQSKYLHKNHQNDSVVPDSSSQSKSLHNCHQNDSRIPYSSTQSKFIHNGYQNDSVVPDSTQSKSLHKGHQIDFVVPDSSGRLKSLHNQNIIDDRHPTPKHSCRPPPFPTQGERHMKSRVIENTNYSTNDLVGGLSVSVQEEKKTLIDSCCQTSDVKYGVEGIQNIIDMDAHTIKSASVQARKSLINGNCHEEHVVKGNQNSTHMDAHTVESAPTQESDCFSMASTKTIHSPQKEDGTTTSIQEMVATTTSVPMMNQPSTDANVRPTSTMNLPNDTPDISQETTVRLLNENCASRSSSNIDNANNSSSLPPKGYTLGSENVHVAHQPTTHLPPNEKEDPPTALLANENVHVAHQPTAPDKHKFTLASENVHQPTTHLPPNEKEDATTTVVSSLENTWFQGQHKQDEDAIFQETVEKDPMIRLLRTHLSICLKDLA
jgi:hypothetical protein